MEERKAKGCIKYWIVILVVLLIMIDKIVKKKVSPVQWVKKYIMALRIPWDEYETAILISAWKDFNSGKCTKKEAVKKVSQTLRKRAENHGIEIDGVFRNENGIAMQFMLVNELMTHEKCGLRSAPKMFINMVELYKSDKKKFQEVLKEAKKTVETGEEKQEQFKSWEHAYEKNECKYAAIEEISTENFPKNEEEEQLALILKDNYENGFRIDSAIDRGRIKVFYNEKFDKELPLSDEQLLVSLKKVGVVREDRIYAKQDDEQIYLLEQIYNNVILIFENGATCVYPEAIYQKYHIELAEKMHIYDAEILGNTLIEMSAGKLRKKQTFLCLTDRQSDLDRDVLEVLKKSPIPMTYEDIQEAMWYIPLDRIKHILVVTKSIVQVEQETYFYAMNLPISQEEIIEVNRLIHRALENRTYITDGELRQLIDENCPGIAINTSEFTTYGLRNCFGYILRDSYSFSGPIISSLGKELSMAEVFAQYCDNREQVTREELKALAAEMNIVIYWDSVRDETIRISDEIFLRYDKVDFKIDEIDRVLDTLCDKSYIPLKDIGLFMHFPALCVQWNGYVLESYIYKYSKKFKLLHASFSASGFFGAMVRQDSGIEDYRALIVDVLANSNQWEDKNSALELLVEKGYQQRRKYANIEKVVHEAKLLREKINATRK